MAVKENVESYDIENHPNPGKCLDWIRSNWDNLNALGVQEVVGSLEALADKFDLTLAYYVSQRLDKGEFISLEGDFDLERVITLRDSGVGLTNTWSDWMLLYAAVEEGSWDIGPAILASLHQDTEYKYSDAVLISECKKYHYRFLASGDIA